MKKFIREAVEAAIREIPLDASMLNARSGRSIRKSLLSRFGQKEAKVLHWNHLADYHAIQHPESWRWPEEYVGNDPIILLFNETDEPSVFKVAVGRDLTRLLEESPGFEFYVTNRDKSFLICHNDHDYLYASGSAKDWLKTLDDRHQAWASSLPPGQPGP